MADVTRAPARAARRTRSPQGSGQLLRDELVAAAGRILAVTGDEEGLSLRAVAREAGVAAPSIYLHFRDKQDLVRAVMEERFAALHGALTAALDAADGPADRVRAGCLAYCRFGLDQPGAYRVLFDNATTAFPGATVDELPGSATLRLLGRALAEAMAAGVVPPGDAVRLTGVVWAGLHGVVSLRRSVPSFPWPPVEEQVDVLLGGLAGLDPAAPAPPLP